MDLIQARRDGVVVLLKEREMVILANAINEILEGVERWEFSTRVGVEREEAEELRRKIGDILVVMEALHADQE